MTQSPSLPELPNPVLLVQFGVQRIYGYTAHHMNAHYLKGYEAGSAAAAQAVPEGYALFCCPKHTGQQFTVAVAYAPPLLQICPHCDPDYLTKLAAPTQGAEGAAPRAATMSEFDGSWSVFNSGGACVIEDVKYDIAADYMTEDRFARGWTMVSVIKSMAALTPSPTPTAPQEADALREAVREILGCPYQIDEETVPSTGLDTPGLNLYQVVGTMHVALPRYRALKAALAQHQPQQGEQQ